MKKLLSAAFMLVLVALTWAGCERALRPSVKLETDGNIALAVIAILADSVRVSVRWSAVADPSGLHHYEWWDTTTAMIGPTGTIAGPSQRATTIFLTDTITVAKPPLNQRYEHMFYVMAVDNRGNRGPYSPGRKWALVRPDVVGPNAPDSIFLDTLVVVPEVALAVGLWPESITIAENERGVLWTAMVISDNRVVCDTIVITGAISRDTTVTYDLMTHGWKFCNQKWDSAVAVARSRVGQNSPSPLYKWSSGGPLLQCEPRKPCVSLPLFAVAD